MGKSVISFRNLEIKFEKSDAPEFIELINKIYVTLIWQYGINEIHIIKIKNWFDHKWLNFSGKAVVQLDGYNVDAALEETWKEKITVPPFHPNRVLSETFFRRQDVQNKSFEKLHAEIKMSNKNLQNRISNKTENGLFIWYSSNSRSNQKGSLMIYRVQTGEIQTFYATFENNNGWAVTKSKGIELNELKLLTSEIRA